MSRSMTGWPFDDFILIGIEWLLLLEEWDAIVLNLLAELEAT